MAQFNRQPTAQSGYDFDAGINAAPGGGYTSGTGWIGNPASGGYKGHLLSCFDLSSMNAAAIMTSAYHYLYIYANNANGSDTNYGHRLKRNWRNSGMNWYTPNDGGGDWQVYGGTGTTNDIDGTASMSAAVSQSPTQGTEISHTFDAYGLAELHKMFDGTYNNNGWLFKHAIEDSGHANQHEYYLMESGYGQSRYPKLIINYDIPSAPGVMIVGLFSLNQEPRHIRWSKKMKKILNPWDVPDWVPELRPI